MISYLMFGLGFYVAAAIFNFESFKEATYFEMFKGLVWGILLWPGAACLAIYDLYIERKRLS